MTRENLLSDNSSQISWIKSGKILVALLGSPHVTAHRNWVTHCRQMKCGKRAQKSHSLNGYIEGHLPELTSCLLRQTNAPHEPTHSSHCTITTSYWFYNVFRSSVTFCTEKLSEQNHVILSIWGSFEYQLCKTYPVWHKWWNNNTLNMKGLRQSLLKQSSGKIYIPLVKLCSFNMK